MHDDDYKGTVGDWGNLVRFNSLPRRWPGATRKEIIDLVFGRDKEKPKGVANGNIQMHDVREQPVLLLWRCIEEYDDRQSKLVLLSSTEREEIVRGEICDIADDIIVLEKGNDVLFGLLDIEEKRPEYKLRPKKMTPKHPGSRADMKRIKATCEACEHVTREIAEGKHLDAQGKIIKGKFTELVAQSLGSEPHGETLGEVWKTLPKMYKRKGRPHEQYGCGLRPKCCFFIFVFFFQYAQTRGEHSFKLREGVLFVLV